MDCQHTDAHIYDAWIEGHTAYVAVQCDACNAAFVAHASITAPGWKPRTCQYSAVEARKVIALGAAS